MIQSLRRIFTRSIRNQLMIGIALVHAVMMTIFIIDLVERQRDFLSRQGQEQTLALAETLAVNSSSWVLARDIVGLEEVLQSNAGYPDLEYAMVTTPLAEILGHTDPGKRGLYPTDPVSRQLLQAEPEPQILIADHRLIDVAFPILVEEELIGWARVGVNQNKVAAGLYAITRDGLLYTIAAILIGSVFAYFMARGLTGGLARLVEVADGTRAGRRDLRAQLDRQDELGHLGQGLDLMLDTIDRQDKESEQLRNQLAQATKMEAMGHMTAGIAHDFNNILGAMRGYTELAKQRLARPEDKDKIDRYLEQVLNASGRAEQLINQMMAFSRHSPDTGKEQPVILLEPICREVVALLRSSVPTTIGLDYSVKYPELVARIQAVNLHQILLNLGVNARDAIGEYGTITIELTLSVISNENCNACHHVFSGEFVEINVSDTGTGIEPEMRDRIFDPFFTTKDVGKGTGMGLSVVHGLVHSAGGHLIVESTKGNGSTIRILLPREQAAKEDTESQIPVEVAYGQSPLQGWRIMVVDDEVAMAGLLEEYLTNQGANVTAFHSPYVALEHFQAEPDGFDLVITDETMPGLRGMHLAKRMKEIRPDINLILCTGYSEQATPESIAEVGIHALLQKPLDMRTLLNKIIELKRD